MAIVISQGGSGSPDTFTTGDANIAYDSFFLRDDASATVDSEDVGQELDNGTSWFTYGGGWQTSAAGTHEVTVSFAASQSGQCYAIHKHNLSDLGVTVKLQTSPDGLIFTDVPGSDIMPANNKTIFFVAPDPISARFWRLVFTGQVSGTLRVAQMFIGPAFKLFQGPNVGFSPPTLALDDEYLNARADGGDFIGRTLIRRGSKTSFSIAPIPQAWVRSFWLPFILEAEAHPFYYSWDNFNFPSEVAYCYTTGRIPPPTYQTHLHFQLQLRFKALQE